MATRKAILHRARRARQRLRWIRHKLTREPSPCQLVVCGYPRGGTSLLYNMLSASLDGFRFAEFEEPARKTLWLYENHASKLPMDVLRLEELPARNRLGKRICVVLVIRDVRDLLTSRHPNVPDDYFMRYEWRWSPRGSAPDYRLVRDPRGIRRVFEAIQTAPRIGGIEVEQVRYEDLVSQPDTVQERLRERFGLGFSSRFSDFHTRKERHAYRYDGDTAPTDASLVRESSKVDISRIGKWRRPEHTDHLKREFTNDPGLFDVLIAHGYETDRDWFDALPSDAGRDT